jgi:hypothetical protein
MAKMKAAVFVEPGRIVLDEKPIPDVGPLDALIRITTTTICGTDVHILKGEYDADLGEGIVFVFHPPSRLTGCPNAGATNCGLDSRPIRHRRRTGSSRRARAEIPTR